MPDLDQIKQGEQGVRPARAVRPGPGGQSRWPAARLRRPAVIIAGGGEQLTLRAVAPLADACNVGGDPETVRHKLTVLRRYCDAAQRDSATIETTHNNGWLLGRDDAAVAAKRQRLAERGPLLGFVGTACKAIDLIGQYQDACVHRLIKNDYRNGIETHELLLSDAMPHFARHSNWLG
jgi:alkanesulfonate monooxygenase SsuD/methylene tetrahydromethanopterin reductase-like flavin-dependent oxidoreductase (luciferase family)